MANPEQWVNLPVNAVHKTDGITTSARLGPLRVRYKTKNAVLSAFKVKIEPNGGDAAYSNHEKVRNPNFRLVVSTTGHNSGTKQGKLLKTLHLPAAGGNLYKVKALYRKKEVAGSITVESRRRLYYQVMHMAGMTAHPTGQLEQALWDPAKKFYIQLLRKPAGAKRVDQIPSISFARGDHNTLLTTCTRAPAFELTPYGKYGFVICYARYITEPKDETWDFTCTVSQPGRFFRRVPSGYEIELQRGNYLWFGMDSADDANRRWLRSTGTCQFRPTGGSWTTVAITGADLQVLPDKDFSLGGHRKLKLTLDDARLPRGRFSVLEGDLRIRLHLRTVDGWTNGFQWKNTVVISNQVQWEPMLAATREYTLVHEVGHRLGMAASGTPSATTPAVAPSAKWQKLTTPDVHDDYYDQGWGGHSGGHCKIGANWDGTNWGGSPTCVMFGADGVGEWVGGVWTVHSAPPTFCAKCEPQVRKVDLS